MTEIYQHAASCPAHWSSIAVCDCRAVRGKKVSSVREYMDAQIKSARNNPVDHPAHYTQHPSGVECIQVAEHMGFNLGNAVKYIWRADLKGAALEDLEKARWYIDREIERRKVAAS